MKNKKTCCCGIVALIIFFVIIGITYVGGYSLGEWSFTTWVGSAVIVVAAVLSMICRQKEDSEDDAE